jgi:site-specific recombinase XerD
MFFLIAAYGLRVSEIAALKLDDVHWRERWMRVPQRKTGTPLLLPLTDAVGTALLRYLRRGRPASSSREFFLRSRAPTGPLKPTAVSMAFEKWSKRSDLEIPFFGAHCLRHSYAVHLLRRGTSLTVIGDLLGHRTTEATCAYLRLDTEDLRDVALPVPEERSQRRRTGRGRQS